MNQADDFNRNENCAIHSSDISPSGVEAAHKILLQYSQFSILTSKTKYGLVITKDASQYNLGASLFFACKQNYPI